MPFLSFLQAGSPVPYSKRRPRRKAGQLSSVGMAPVSFLTKLLLPPTSAVPPFLLGGSIEPLKVPGTENPKASPEVLALYPQWGGSHDVTHHFSLGCLSAKWDSQHIPSEFEYVLSF